MKLNVKSIVAGMVMGCILTSGVTVLASNGTKSIQATFKNIKIFVDGAELTPRDSKGNVLEPFIYNGSTYLPARAISEAVGKNVSYDANTNSVYIGNGNNSVSSETYTRGVKLEPYKTENAGITDLKMGGVNYSNALFLDSGYGATAYYNLVGGYTSLSGVYGFKDDGCVGGTAEIAFYGDGHLIQKLNADYNQLPKNFVVNVTGVSQLVIEAKYINEKDCNWTALGDMSFK
jgi:hypothetical protein